MRRGIRIIGSFGARTRADMPEMIRLAAQGVFQPEKMVSRRYPLTQADEAYKALARGEIVGRAIVMPRHHAQCQLAAVKYAGLGCPGAGRQAGAGVDALSTH